MPRHALELAQEPGGESAGQARKTNPEIAGELFLSPKRVETHLRHIFHKMDVPSRVALARAVERADRTASARPS